MIVDRIKNQKFEIPKLVFSSSKLLLVDRVMQEFDYKILSKIIRVVYASTSLESRLFGDALKAGRDTSVLNLQTKNKSVKLRYSIGYHLSAWPCAVVHELQFLIHLTVYWIYEFDVKHKTERNTTPHFRIRIVFSSPFQLWNLSIYQKYSIFFPSPKS